MISSRDLPTCALSLLALAAPAQEFKVSGAVKTDYDKTRDFSKYKTFTWSEAQERGSNPADHIRIFGGIETELLAKGFTKDDTGKPDLRVRYFSKVERKLKGSPGQSETSWTATSNQRTTVDFKLPREGTLTVTFYDGDSGDVVWSGSSSETVGRADEVPDQIKNMVTRIMRAFPPPPSAGQP
jgi:Domain of unknown function (DUF4136)